MNIKIVCPTCKGNATLSGTLPEDWSKDCPNCSDGYIRTEIESDELSDIMAKCNDILEQVTE